MPKTRTINFDEVFAIFLSPVGVNTTSSGTIYVFLSFLCHISPIYLSLLTSVAFDWLPHVHFDVSNMEIRQ